MLSVLKPSPSGCGRQNKTVKHHNHALKQLNICMVDVTAGLAGQAAYPFQNNNLVALRCCAQAVRNKEGGATMRQRLQSL